MHLQWAEGSHRGAWGTVCSRYSISNYSGKWRQPIKIICIHFYLKNDLILQGLTSSGYLLATDEDNKTYELHPDGNRCFLVLFYLLMLQNWHDVSWLALQVCKAYWMVCRKFIFCDDIILNGKLCWNQRLEVSKVPILMFSMATPWQTHKTPPLARKQFEIEACTSIQHFLSKEEKLWTTIEQYLICINSVG